MAKPIVPKYEATAMKLSEAAQRVLTHLVSVKNYSDETVKGYQLAMDNFHFYLHSQGLTDEIKNFNGQTCFGFMEWLASKGMKSSTICLRLTALSTVARMLMKATKLSGSKPLLLSNPTKEFDWPVPDQAETKFLLPAELAAFMKVELPLHESLARDILLNTGVRVSELAKANVEDVITIDGRTQVAVIRKGKGRKARKDHVFVSPPVAAAIYEYLLSRSITSPQDPAHMEEPLLLNARGERWRRTAMSELMKRIGEKAGIKRFRVSAHKIRHTLPPIMDLAGIPDYTQSKMLGHTSTQSLQRYKHLIPGQTEKARDAQVEAMQRYIGEIEGELK